jgi:putative heme-binding domain-containing protein
MRGLVLAAVAPFCFAQDDLAARLFQANCTYCHGARGEGGRGPDLTLGRYKRGGSDAELFATIRNGVPGTEMPAVRATDDEVRRLVAYVRTLAQPRVAAQPIIDVGPGRAVFERSGCARCHSTGVGPDLSAIGLRREPAHLRESILRPDAEVAIPFRPIAVVPKRGAPAKGMRLNEDDVSIQLRTFDGALRSFLKADLAEIRRAQPTPMPSFSTMLSAREIDDLVSYLSSLREDQ